MVDDNFAEAVPLPNALFKRLAPNFPMSSYVYGRELVQKGDYKEGIEHRKFCEKCPGNPHLPYCLSGSLRPSGPYEDARRERAISNETCP